MNWYKFSKYHSLDKKYIHTLKDGAKIYLVNGGYVRDHFDVDFYLGGHHYAYPKFIPINEIWIERSDTDQDDMIAIIAHEIEEYKDMKYKHEKYPEAHRDALCEEKKVRKEEQEKED